MTEYKKLSDLTVLNSPDGNDYVIVLQKSNDGLNTYRAFKTEISTFLSNSGVEDAIASSVNDHLGNINAVLHRISYQSLKQQLVLNDSVELVVNAPRIADGSSLNADPMSVVPKMYIDNAISSLADSVNTQISDITGNYIRETGGTMSGQLLLSVGYPTNPRAAISLNSMNDAIAAAGWMSRFDDINMVGRLIAAQDPVTNLEVATKKYVDDRLGTLGIFSTTDDLDEGTTNKYYTDVRARGAISAAGDISYNTVTGVISFTSPQINLPTKVSDLTNDLGFITHAVTDPLEASIVALRTDKATRSEFKTVAFTGSYVDLTDKPAGSSSSRFLPFTKSQLLDMVDEPVGSAAICTDANGGARPVWFNGTAWKDFANGDI